MKQVDKLLRKIKEILGFDKLHPDIQYFLDRTNLKIALPGAFVVMFAEVIAFINTFFYTINEGQDPQKWLLFHRALYLFLFLAAAQLFVYALYHKVKNVSFSRIRLDISILFFFFALLVFGICISIKDYEQHEQILVFITIEMFVSCLFMIKPYLAIILIVIPFGIFYYLMEITAGVSGATKANYITNMIFFIIVNIAHYQQYLRIANQSLDNQELAEQLRNASRYDFLTKLKNRTALNMDFENPGNKNLNSNFIVMVTDIDNFKSFNDTNGHAYGDELLGKFAAVLRENFGKKYCYRYGGDEYLVVIPEMPEEVFSQKIKICQKALNNEFNFSGGYTKGFVKSSADLHSLIYKADQNLYAAKNAGKNQVIGSL